jgi:hypothetical protein
MKANEIRIGNLVEATNDDVVFPYVITAQEIVFYHSDPKRFNPIPLGKEWFDKIKWELEKGEFYYFLDNNYFSINTSGQVYYMGDYTAVNVEYLHDLQNLYFAITGEELTFSGMGGLDV